MQFSKHVVPLCALATCALLGVGAAAGSYPAYLIALAMVNVIAALGLNLLIGNSGQISLCHSSFMAIGAYSSSLLASTAGFPFWASIPAGALVAAIVGAVLGMPARRLSGVYLALATLGFLQIVQIVIEEFSDVTGGVRGLNTAKPSLLGTPLTSYGIYCVVAVVCVAAVWLSINIKRSRIGREFDAVRLSPHAAQALGISVARVKLTAFSLSAGYAGLAGGLFAILVGFIDPNEFGIGSSLKQLTYVVVGGLGSIGGSVAGAAILSGLPELLRPIKEYTDIAAALILLAALLFMPDGLASAWQRAISKRKPAKSKVVA